MGLTIMGKKYELDVPDYTKLKNTGKKPKTYRARAGFSDQAVRDKDVRNELYAKYRGKNIFERAYRVFHPRKTNENRIIEDIVNAQVKGTQKFADDESKMAFFSRPFDSMYSK